MFRVQDGKIAEHGTPIDEDVHEIDLPVRHSPHCFFSLVVMWWWFQ